MYIIQYDEGHYGRPVTEYWFNNWLSDNKRIVAVWKIKEKDKDIRELETINLGIPIGWDWKLKNKISTCEGR
jgi:hypothetical protein